MVNYWIIWVNSEFRLLIDKPNGMCFLNRYAIETLLLHKMGLFLLIRLWLCFNAYFVYNQNLYKQKASILL